MEIYVLKDGVRYGPYSTNELRQHVETGAFQPEHFASLDGCRNWTSIGQIREIAAGSFRVELDEPRNLLLISYYGRVGRKEMERCPEEIQRALPKLKRDFELLADFSQLESMDVSCAPLMATIMDLCNEAGVTSVIRVIPRTRHDIGLQIMSLFHYDDHVQIQTCTSREEAMRILCPEHPEKINP